MLGRIKGEYTMNSKLLKKITNPQVENAVISAVKAGADYDEVVGLLVRNCRLTMEEASAAWAYHRVAHRLDTSESHTALVYKIVYHSQGRLWSLIVADGLEIEYQLGKKVFPPAGKLFAFSNLEDALGYLRLLRFKSDRTHIYRAQAGLSSDETHTRVGALPTYWALAKFDGDRRKLVNAVFALPNRDLAALSQDWYIDLFPAPLGTVYCDWIELTERVDIDIDIMF